MFRRKPKVKPSPRPIFEAQGDAGDVVITPSRKARVHVQSHPNREEVSVVHAETGPGCFQCGKFHPIDDRHAKR